ncbi:MAG: hypothetical protein ABIQ18_38475 [Umezawaea sp.]
MVQKDIGVALDAAARIGIDFIRKELGGGKVDTTQFSHRSSVAPCAATRSTPMNWVEVER